MDLDLLAYKEHLSLKKKEDKTYVFDPIRKKYLLLLPEEFTRQLLLQYLIRSTSYERNLIQVEKSFRINDKLKRFDIVVYNEEVKPHLLIECKSHKINLSQHTFDQIAVYNLVIGAPYLCVTNGRQTMVARVNLETQNYEFLDHLPP